MDKTEISVEKYFDKRYWKGEKLDLGNEEAADFRFTKGDESFLCEIKTIISVHADYPYTPAQYINETRQKQLEEIQTYLTENPETKILHSSEEHEFLNSTEAEIFNQFRYLRRNTEEEFNNFAQRFKDHLDQSSIRDFPYRLRLDSDNFYVPNKTEEKKFIEWLEVEIQNIDSGIPSRLWKNDGVIKRSLFSIYLIHEAQGKGDKDSRYQLTVEGPLNIEAFDVTLFSNGGLNLNAITSNVEKAVRQLNESSKRESDSQIPQVIILSFERGILWPEHWLDLEKHINWLFQEHQRISTIAVLDSVPTDTPPANDAHFMEIIFFQLSSPRETAFTVFHNPNLEYSRPLSRDVFDDGNSIQKP